MGGRLMRSQRSDSRRPRRLIMTGAAIRRRVRNLEEAFASALMPDYPLLSFSEIADFERRSRASEMLGRAELDRLEQHSPVIDREILMVCHGGTLTVKRYPGIDLAEV
jgi:hypothetical protein